MFHSERKTFAALMRNRPIFRRILFTGRALPQEQDAESFFSVLSWVI
jgi:hypothetical protein